MDGVEILFAQPVLGLVVEQRCDQRAGILFALAAGLDVPGLGALADRALGRVGRRVLLVPAAEALDAAVALGRLEVALIAGQAPQ